MDGRRGKAPAGGKARVGDVVRWVFILPKEAQNRPAKAFWVPFHRSSPLWTHMQSEYVEKHCADETYVFGPPSPIHAHSSAPGATDG